jgi:hypothetical protein
MLSLFMASHEGIASAFHQKADSTTLNHCTLSADRGGEKPPVEKNHDGCITCQTCCTIHNFIGVVLSFEAFVATPETRNDAPQAARIYIAQSLPDGHHARAPPILA